MSKNLFKMTQAECDSLNPPFNVGDVVNTKEWLYVGHIPTPKTRIGWFIYNVIHGLSMRYRLLPVLSFSVSEFFRNNSDREVSLIASDLASDDGMWCNYDDVTDLLSVFFYGKPKPNYVSWLDNKFATIHDESNDDVIGIMISGYKK